MKKLNLLILFFLPLLLFGQNNIYEEIQDKIKYGEEFNTVKVFKDINYDLSSENIDRNILQKGLTANLDLKVIQALHYESPSSITLEVPRDDGDALQIQLVQHDIFTEGFTVRNSKSDKDFAYNKGLHFKGIVEGSENSIAAISIFKDEIIGMVSLENSSYVIAKQGGRDKHIIYADDNLLMGNPNTCGTPFDGNGYTEEELNFDSSLGEPLKTICLYIEIDNDIVVDKGGVTGATNYVTGLFNESIVLYANENVPMIINEIFAWDTPSPYSSSSSSGMLNDFQNNTGVINGDLGHLVSYQASGGIAAGFSGLCASNPDDSKCFSSISSSYSSVPTYSWSVMVITHEMGHLVGSRHTHACVWNGNNTAIDGCSGFTEGNCSTPGFPSNGGTIMSYCHLQNVGINFNEGFGEQPGNVIRSNIANAGCLGNCCEEPEVDYIIVDENGNPKTDFCVGDEIFLNGCVSENATRYFIGIWEYESGGYAAGDDNVSWSGTNPFWIESEPGCLMNLNDIWDNYNNYEFRADHEYRIQFAVDNDCSNEWIVKEDELFTVSFPTPEYHYVDANGNPKDVFCLGEPVYMDGSASSGEDKYFLSIWQYNIGGFDAGEDNLGYSRLDPEWAQGEVGSLINLNEIWDNFEGDYFEPGYEYRVQLAVQGPCDRGWNVKDDEFFTVICCDGVEYCKAEFTVSTEEQHDGNIIFNFNNNDEIYYNHTWTVFQHDNSGEGPYTEIQTSNDPDFGFIGEIGGCYTIVHAVETPCGSCCYSREICNDFEEGRSNSLVSSNESVDCDLLCDLTTPDGLSCKINKSGYLVLFWNEVPGATSYEVTLNFSDPDCCGKESKETNSAQITSESNSITLEYYPICMSWTVTAICDDTRGQTSKKKCFSYKDPCFKEIPNDNPQDDGGLGLLIDPDIKLYPNPVTDILQYDINLNKGEVLQGITLLNIDGSVIDRINFNTSNSGKVRGEYNINQTSPGIYFMQFQLNTQTITKKVIVIK